MPPQQQMSVSASFGAWDCQDQNVRSRPIRRWTSGWWRPSPKPMHGEPGEAGSVSSTVWCTQAIGLWQGTHAR